MSINGHDRDPDIWRTAESMHPRAVCRCGHAVRRHYFPSSVDMHGRSLEGLCASVDSEVVEATYRRLVAEAVLDVLVPADPEGNFRRGRSVKASLGFSGLWFNKAAVFMSLYAPGSNIGGPHSLSLQPNRTFGQREGEFVYTATKIVDSEGRLVWLDPSVDAYYPENENDLSWGFEPRKLRRYLRDRIIRVPAIAIPPRSKWHLEPEVVGAYSLSEIVPIEERPLSLLERFLPDYLKSTVWGIDA